MTKDGADALLYRIRYFSHMYWKGKIEADMALIAFADLDDLLCSGAAGPCEWEGMM